MSTTQEIAKSQPQHGQCAKHSIRQHGLKNLVLEHQLGFGPHGAATRDEAVIFGAVLPNLQKLVLTDLLQNLKRVKKMERRMKRELTNPANLQNRPSVRDYPISGKGKNVRLT